MRELRSLRYITRFAIHHTNKPETVAEHSFFTAIYAYHITLKWNELEPGDICIIPLIAMRMALFHDIPEAVTGDLPYLFKRMAGIGLLEKIINDELILNIGFEYNTMNIPAEYELIIDFADALELKIYLEEERMSGNMHLWDIEKETYSRLVHAEIPEKVKNYYLDRIKAVPGIVKKPKFTYEGMQWGNERKGL